MLCGNISPEHELSACDNNEVIFIHLKNKLFLKTDNLKLLIYCGLTGPLFFIVSFCIQGMYKHGYSALLYPISSLAIGENGWIQIVTFIVSGLLIFLFSIAVKKKLNHKLVAALLALVGIGLICAGIFITDPVFGFPENIPFIKIPFTLYGKLHTWFSLLVFLGIPVICFMMSKYFNLIKDQGWKYYSIATGIIMLILFLFTGMAFNQLWGWKTIAGLLQRLCVITGFVWISLFSIKLRTLQ